MCKFITILMTLLLLLGCGGSGTSSVNNSTAPPTPAPTPTPTPTPPHPDLTQNRLLTDEELYTPELPTVPSPSAEYAEWVNDKHHKLRSLTYDGEFSDLAFLADVLDGKRIVQLGESTHGSREFNQTKVRLIKYLHQELNYNVIAFESSLTGCHILDKDVVQLSPREAMEGCIFPVWHTEEVIELFDYVIATHTTDTPLKIAGFDVQTSGEKDIEENYHAFFKNIIEHFDPNYWPEAEQAISLYFEAWTNGLRCTRYSDACVTFDEIKSDSLARLESLESFLRAHIGNTTEVVENEFELDLRIALISSYSMRAFIETADAEYIESFNVRDAGMARNLTALAETAYQTEKIMVWAHNGHITYDDRHEEIAWMGERLKPYWQEEIYTIGFYMIRGQQAFNDRRTGDVDVAHPDESLEAIAYTLRTAAAFIPFSKANETSIGDDWLHKPISVKSWGSYEMFLTLSDSYDAVIVIDRSQVPVYLN